MQNTIENITNIKDSKSCSHNKISSKRIDLLLEDILKEARKVTNADAGSIYIPFEDNEKSFLQIRVGQNDTLNNNQPEDNIYSLFHFPIDEKSICGYVALTGQVKNIPDVYNIPEEVPYSFNKTLDKVTGYRTKSMLVCPLNSSDGKLLAVIQLINAKDEQGNFIPFSLETQVTLNHFICSDVLPDLQECLQKTDRLQTIVEIEKELALIQDKDTLLERILTETRKLVHADAGSIYEVIHDSETGESRLQIKYGQNETRERALKPGEKLPYTSFDFPINEKSICGWVALNKKALNIDDVYNLAEDTPYKFNQQTDILTGYKTHSMYTVPLLSSSGELFGVIQIINALNDHHEVIPFSQNKQDLINHFALTVIKPLERTALIRKMNQRTLKMSELRDPKETWPHVERVSKFSLEIYDRWAFNNKVSKEEMDNFKDMLAIAAMFHDVGKVGISDVILKKPAKFDPEERMIMQRHTCLGATLFADGEQTALDEMSQDIALHHHEWWDGSEKAYPGKVDLSKFNVAGTTIPEAEVMKGEEIPLSARIVAIADVFDALSHRRCYKEAWSMDDVISEIEKSSGTQFDPNLVKAFLERKDRIIAINESIKDDD